MQLFLTVVECLLSGEDLRRGRLVANADHLALFTGSEHVVVDRASGHGSRLACPPAEAVCLDPLHNVLWMQRAQALEGFHALLGDVRRTAEPGMLATLRPSLALPIRPGSLVTRSHLALYLLGALDTLVRAQALGFGVVRAAAQAEAADKADGRPLRMDRFDGELLGFVLVSSASRVSRNLKAKNDFFYPLWTGEPM